MVAGSNSKRRTTNEIERILRNWDARLRLTQTLVWLPRGMAAGLLIAVIVAVAARFWPIIATERLIPLSVVLALLGTLIAVAAVWLWRRSVIQKARRFDLVFGLKERMSTAVELSGGMLQSESAYLSNRQIEQALKVAGHVRPAEGLPFEADWREWIMPLVGAAAIAAAVVIPNPQDNIIDQQLAVAEEIERQVEELQELREEVLTNEELTAEEQQAIVEALDEAIQTLEQGDISQEEAVAALQAAQEELRDISDHAAAEQQAAMEEASGLLEGTEAQAAADALAAGDAAAAAEALSNLDLDSLTPEEAAELAEALEAAADALEGTNPEAAEALQDAAEALQNGDTAAAEQALGEAGEAMQGDQTAQEVDEYADQVGKGQQSVGSAGQEGSQPGQSGMGQTQQGQGQGQGQGQSQGSTGAGEGEGQGEAQGGQEGQMEGSDGPANGGESTSEEIFDPQRIGGEGGPEVDVPGDPGAGMPTGSEGEFVDNPDGDSSVPYEDVYGEYTESVNEALESGYVPLGLRNLIQQYFGNLDPE